MGAMDIKLVAGSSAFVVVVLSFILYFARKNRKERIGELDDISQRLCGIILHHFDSSYNMSIDINSARELAFQRGGYHWWGSDRIVINMVRPARHDAKAFQKDVFDVISEFLKEERGFLVRLKIKRRHDDVSLYGL